MRAKPVVLTDDMIDTGGTIAGAVKLLREDGAKDVIIAATHGVLSDPARRGGWQRAEPARSSSPTPRRSRSLRARS